MASETPPQTGEHVRVWLRLPRAAVLALVSGAVALRAALPVNAGALCDGIWGELLQDPAVQQAIDEAWKSTKEGTPDEKEVGGVVYRCDDPSAPGKTITIVETFEGAHDSGEIHHNPENGCEMVGFFHTHPGKGEDDKYKYEVPSDTDMDTSANFGVPGLIIFGEGSDTADTGKIVFDGGGNYEPCDNPPGKTAPPPTGGGPPGTGKIFGDPHLTTFDGYPYNFQAAGEFVLVRSTSGDFEVQVRQTPPTAHARHVTVASAAAVRIDGAVIEVSETEVIVDGVAHDRAASETIALPRGGEVVVSPSFVDYRSADGTRVIHAGGSVIVALAKARAGSVEGLLGDFDGDRANDLVAGGALLLADRVAGFDELYGAFRDAWQVSAESSLFTYPDGRSTADYVVEEIPGAPAIAGFLPERVRARAEAACAAAGVTDVLLLGDCILDVGTTGDASFAAEAAGVSDLTRRITRSYDVPAVVTAALQGRLAQVQELLAGGADVNAVDPATGRSALIVSAIGNRLDILRTLLGARAIVDLADDDGTTALLGAARWGHEDAAKLLIAAGADVARRDGRTRSALSLAAARGDAATVTVLVNAGAQVNAEDSDSRTPLSWAVVGGDIDTVRTLVDAGADVNHAGVFGNTALHEATLWRLTAVVDVLLGAGADPSIANKSGQTPADMATAAGNTELAERLKR